MSSGWESDEEAAEDPSRAQPPRTPCNAIPLPQLETSGWFELTKVSARKQRRTLHFNMTRPVKKLAQHSSKMELDQSWRKRSQQSWPASQVRISEMVGKTAMYEGIDSIDRMGRWEGRQLTRTSGPQRKCTRMGATPKQTRRDELKVDEFTEDEKAEGEQEKNEKEREESKQE
eukprot:768308-Hanusia_phi.AAC.1